MLTVLCQLFLSLFTTVLRQQFVTVYNIQSTDTLASVTSVFSLQVSFNILDLIILEFLL
jgi:hypothetical protein